jgi:HSP20 family protein
MNHYPSIRNQHASWSPLSEFRREFDQLFDDFWSPTPSARRSREMDWSPACEVLEKNGDYLLTLEVAGTPKEKLKLEVDENRLTISGERESETFSDDEGNHYSERRFGKFQRSFSLPAGTDVDRIEASYQDGLLRIHVPKAASTQPKRIEITDQSSNNPDSPGLLAKWIGNGSSKKKPDKPDRVA